MTIQTATLGFLTSRPRSGYDLKREFRDDPYLHWSGNNNQIYRTLLQLERDGLVDSRVETPERGPAKKVYSITDQGRARLRAELLQPPELPEVRNPFLASITFMDALRADGTLSETEVAGQLQAYANLLETEIVAWEERTRRLNAGETSVAPDSKARVVLQAMHRRWIDYYEREKRWIDRLAGQIADQLAETTQEERDDH